MAAKMTGDLRARIRSMATTIRPEWVARYYGVTSEDVQSVTESEPTAAEVAAKGKREAALVDSIVTMNPDLSADALATLRASVTH